MSEPTLDGLAGSVSIFPAIGVARVGNTGPGDTTEDYYLPPTGIGRLPTDGDGAPPFDASGFRDRHGRLRKQAATFALYHDDRDEPLTIGTTLPLPGGGTARIVDVVWTVHLANKKAAWYQFEGGVGEKGYPPRHPLRNADVTGEERRNLIIDPGPRTVSTRGARTGEFDGNDGHGRSTFPPDGPDPDRERITTLGRITASDDGGLVLLGGSGIAYTTGAAPALGDDDNNDQWWDDVSDGPVSAKIVVRVHDQRGEPIGREQDIRVGDRSWVIVAPPSYAPEIVTLVTLYDTLFDMAVRHEGIRRGIYREGQWQPDYQPHYPTEIEPILRRAVDVPWVVAVPPKVHTFDLDRLGTKDPRYDQIRRYLFESLRPPQAPNTLSSADTGYRLMPYIAGDDISSQLTAKFHTLTPTQYFLLGQWADGNFRTADQVPNPRSGPEWHPGHRLTTAALGNSSGPPFSPGIEMGWLSRVPAVYAKPFRFRFQPVANLPVEAGRLSLTTDPASGLEPGDVTKYMSVPWQADFNGCSAHEADGHYFWWWPAHRPMFVYARRERPATVSKKDEWRHVGWVGTIRDQTAADYVAFTDRLEMAEHWHELGFVMHNARTGPRDDTDAPDPPRFVEVRRTLPRPGYVHDDHNPPRA